MSPNKSHIVLTRPGFSHLLGEEWENRWQLSGQRLNNAAVAYPDTVAPPNLEQSIFARQYLPRATQLRSSDDAVASQLIVKKLQVMAKRPNRQAGAWTLQIFGIDDDAATARAARLEKSVLAALRKGLPAFMARYRDQAEWTGGEREAHDVIVQVYLPSSDELWLSIASLANGISPFIAGAQRMRHRSGSPSRSSSKLEEAFVCLGLAPNIGDTAVDLGAAPGGWTFTLVRHGATVTAVDHGALQLPDTKTMRERVHHLQDDGLTYTPPAAVDWLCADMLIGSREALKVLRRWFEQGWMQHFVVNIKLPQAKPWPVIREALALIEAQGWARMRAKHLYHDRQEITLMGSRRPV